MTRTGVLRTPLGRLRWIGYLEGASFVVLLGVAMPLKYLAGMPLAVRIVGSAHGALFVAYLVAIALAVRAKAWPLREAGTLVVASLLPLGPFLVDGRLRAAERGADATAPTP